MPVHPDGYFGRMQSGAVPRPAVSALLGGVIRAVDVEAGTLASDYAGRPEFFNPAGQVQGGILCAMLDDVTAMLVTATVGPGEACATLNLNVSFLKPGQVGPILGKSRLVRRGRDICNVTGELWQDDKLIATASATCMIARPR